MIATHSYPCFSLLLCALLFAYHGTSAPIRRLVAESNPFSPTTFSLNARSINARQIGGPFGPPPPGNRNGPFGYGPSNTLFPHPPETTFFPGPQTTTFAPPPPASNTAPSPPPASTTPSGVPPPPASSNSGPPPTSSIPPPPPTSFVPPTPSVSTSLSPSGTVAPPNTSSIPSAPSASSVPPGSTTPTLQLSLVNNLGSNNVHTYITGLDSTGAVVMLTTDGSFYYAQSLGTTTPQAITANIAISLAGPGQTTQITIPDYISSARVWFADGTLSFSVVDTQYGPGLVEPTVANPDNPSVSVNWGFVELTNNEEDGLFANLSFVDFVGLPLGLQLDTSSSGTQSALGVPPDAVTQVCNDLKGKAAEGGQPWDQLCSNPLRVASPATLISSDANAFVGYWDSYVNDVWQKYTSTQLTINTQSSTGQVACTSDGTSISCASDNRPYPKPSSADIFGCNSGPFAIEESDNDVHRAVLPRLCAALNRATLLLQGGEVQPSLPPSEYYTTEVNNWYSAFVHRREVDGKGYAFSYDDVASSVAESVAGAVSARDPRLLTVFVGGVASG